jgi:hypothetical protein
MAGKNFPGHSNGPTSMTRHRPFSCQSERPARASGTPPGRDICHRTRGPSSRISAVRSRELDHGQLAGASGRGVVAAAVRPQAARSALDDVGVASAPAPAGIDVLHLNAAVLRRPGPPVPPSSTCPFAGKDPLVAQLRWQKAAYGSDTLAMAQILWQRTTRNLSLTFATFGDTCPVPFGSEALCGS